MKTLKICKEIDQQIHYTSIFEVFVKRFRSQLISHPMTPNINFLLSFLWNIYGINDGYENVLDFYGLIFISMRELLKKKFNLQYFVNDKDEIRLMYKKVPIDAVMIPIERSDFMYYISSDVSILILQSKC